MTIAMDLSFSRMCQSTGHRTLCVLFLCLLLFSSSSGRPKAPTDDVVEMSVGTPATEPSDSNEAPATDTASQHQPQHEPNTYQGTDPPALVVGPENKIETDTKPAEEHVQAQEHVQEHETKEPEHVQEHGTKSQEEAAEGTKAGANVHDIRSRAMVEQMKHMQYVAGDTEEIMHGGHHVHADGHKEESKQQIGVGGVDMADLVGGPKKEEVKTAPMTLDTEDLMHGNDGSHGHNPHDEDHKKEVDEKHAGPSADNPEDLIHIVDMELQAEHRRHQAPSVENPEEASHSRTNHGHGHNAAPKDKQAGEGGNVGVSIEKVVHGDEHAHDHSEGVMEEYVDEDGVTHKKKLGKQITLEDVENLGLSKKELEGIDLGKLLRRDKAEYDAWKKEEAEVTTKDKSFWDKIDDFRDNYFNMLSKQIRHMSRSDDDDDDPEWDDGTAHHDDRPHPGESAVEHESEMWASTKSKKDRHRRGFTVIHDTQTHDGVDEL